MTRPGLAKEKCYDSGRRVNLVTRGRSARQPPHGVSGHGNEVLRGLASSPMPPMDQAGALLMYIWGYISNLSRVSFWLLAHILANHESYARLQDSIDCGYKAGLEDSGHTLHNAPQTVIGGPSFLLLDSAMKEAGRLYTLPTAYRIVGADIELSVDSGTFWARKGDIVTANVLGMHWNERFFDDPSSFRIDRFVDLELNKSRHLSLFGHGTHMVRIVPRILPENIANDELFHYVVSPQCPGRHIGSYCTKMLVIQCLLNYDIIPVDGRGKAKLPTTSPRSVGTMIPNEDVQVVIVERPRKDGVPQ